MERYTAGLLLVLVALAIVGAGATYIPGESARGPKNADEEFLKRQISILEVLQNIYQDSFFDEQVQDGKNYSFEENIDQYTNQEAVKEFLQRFKNGNYQGLLKGEIFSIFDEEQRMEAIALFKLFYYAKDWNTFYKTMAWARNYMNEGLFVYALTISVIHRDDMQGIILPAIYEIFPNYFYPAETIQKAYHYKMMGLPKFASTAKSIIIPSNYTGWYFKMNDEQKISYFTEDIGLNSYYYYFQADYAFWMDGEEFGLKKDRRGELYLYMHQQLLARYYLERLSNGLGEIPEFSWKMPIKTGYYSSLRYPNGLDFPYRSNDYFLYNEDKMEMMEKVMDYERRIRDTIDLGYIKLPDSTYIDLRKAESIDPFGNLIQGNVDSPNFDYYKSLIYFTKTLLGGGISADKEYKFIPGIMEQFETSMRDPMFYQLYKRILKYFYQLRDYLPTYTAKDLDFPGLQIENVEIDPLITYFDTFDSDISNSICYNEKEKLQHEQYYALKARQQRLNHKPFSYKLDVTSDKAQDVVIRVYLGPKYDSYGSLYDIEDNRYNFIELDQYLQKVTIGKNTITRNTREYVYNVADRTSASILYAKAQQAYTGKSQFPLDMSEAHCGWPDRLLLPKGSKAGTEFQMYFIITPYNQPMTEQGKNYDESISCGIGSGSRYLDSLPFGYPFDRKINRSTFFTPNMFFKDVTIYHKLESQINQA